MKKVFLGLMIAVLLFTAMPSIAFAAPTRTMAVDMNVVAVDRSLEVDPLTGTVTGTVYYVGTVTNILRQCKELKKIEGASVLIVEQVSYQIDQFGNVLAGAANGCLTITGNHKDSALINYSATISGNIFVGPAFDIGTWEVASATGSLHIFKDAAGTWTAAVQQVTIGGNTTFAGTASVTGSF